MFNLIKKDFLIVKKMSLIMGGLTLMFPVFINFIAASEKTILPFVLVSTAMIMILGIIFFSSIYEEEEKFPKSKALITTIGYTRKIQILERYVLAAIMFIFITMVVTIESKFLPNINTIALKDFAITFLVFTLLFGLFFFLTTKYGIRAGRYVHMIVILLISLGPMALKKLNIDFSVLKSINEKTLIGTCFVVGIVFYLVTYILSVKIYESRDL